MMSLERDGAERIEKALSEAELRALDELARSHSGMAAGVRIAHDETLSQILAAGGSTMDKIAKSRLGNEAQPVRAILFDKQPGANWALGWHQDRTIAVRSRKEVPGFGPWSRKAGIDHVEPPFEYIERTITLRAHLDACARDNAPLTIVPGSHRLGRIPVQDIEGVVSRHEAVVCLAEAGDVWIYATAILHASGAAKSPTHRRVLHVDYSNAQLPSGLEWFGVR
jgi:ectoine hydroxylase-related dioxygenase (phytanoyl-CoA dioxygenase family)